MKSIRIPHDSNLRYLPMMYFLPDYLIARCPTLRKLPRNLREILESDTLKATVESDQFFNEIMDATAALAFPHFGFGGWKEHYTGYSPVWQLSYALQLWTDLLKKETDISFQALYELPIIPFFQPDYIKMIMEQVVHYGIYLQNWQPILDVVKQMPCEEDFEKWNTNAYKMFRRKWYHTRYYKKRNIKVVSLEDLKYDENDNSNDVAVDEYSCFEDDVCGRDYVEQFKALLSPKDKEIITLRAHGYTYEKIAEKLGYKNHSGVIKRVKFIRKVFEEFEAQQSQIR
jgi:hypothetical protein